MRPHRREPLLMPPAAAQGHPEAVNPHHHHHPRTEEAHSKSGRTPACCIADRGLVYVSATRRPHQAVCTCGWRGRLFCPSTAVLDALTHARVTGCQPCHPLVWPISVHPVQPPPRQTRSSPNPSGPQPDSR